MFKKIAIAAASLVLLTTFAPVAATAAPAFQVTMVQHQEYRDHARYRYNREQYRREVERREYRNYRMEPPRGRIVGRHGGRPAYDYRNGHRIGEVYRGPRREIRDHRRYGLPAPRHGYRYYETDTGDIVMAAIVGGIIGMILAER